MCMADDSPFIDPADAMAMALKLTEMAERVKSMDRICPGTQAKWAFKMDDTLFEVFVVVAKNVTEPK